MEKFHEKIPGSENIKKVWKGVKGFSIPPIYSLLFILIYFQRVEGTLNPAICHILRDCGGFASSWFESIRSDARVSFTK